MHTSEKYVPFLPKIVRLQIRVVIGLSTSFEVICPFAKCPCFHDWITLSDRTALSAAHLTAWQPGLLQSYYIQRSSSNVRLVDDNLVRQEGRIFQNVRKRRFKYEKLIEIYRCTFSRVIHSTYLGNS